VVITILLLIGSLPTGNYDIGDNAYTCSEHLLTPFSGENRNDRTKNTYNFYVAQLRIHTIEIAFGLLTPKWRILQSPLQILVKNVGILFMAITRFHNCCINKRVEEDNYITQYNNNHPPIKNDTVDNNTNRDFVPSKTTTSDIPGHSMIQDLILESIVQQGLSRPAYNSIRNQKRNNINQL
jgi:DDE superfamily endonuclease